MKLRRKPIWIVIAWTAVILWMAFIFSMSAEPAVESNKTSGGVAELILKIFVPDFEEFSSAERAEMVDGIQHVVRKGAHFCGYTLMGILLCVAFSGHFERYRHVAPSAFLVGALYAASDELHQRFVPGRSGEIKDILLDSSGVAFGIMISVIFILLMRKRAPWRG